MNDLIRPETAVSPNEHDDTSRNTSGNPDFDAILRVRMSRRALLKGSFAAAATSLFGTSLAGCNDSDKAVAVLALGFIAVGKSLADTISIPAGYTAHVLYSLGDAIDGSVADFMNDGSDSAASFEHRAGDHHDGMSYFGLNNGGTAPDANNSKRGLLAMNHENITQIFLHTPAQVAAYDVTARQSQEIDKEVNVHGVSVLEIVRDGGPFQVNKGSLYNRRLTAASLMDISGPARGASQLITRFSPAGTQTRGTLNNCANGSTPWGTYLTCEENWAGYFKRGTDSVARSAKEAAALARYGVTSSNGSYGWANPAGGDSSGVDLYNRWNIAKTSADPAQDFANAANTQGWVVEIDPYSPTSVPRKRTALGRFAHEGAMPAKVSAGKPLVYYMGDDARTEYIYKYVSNKNWEPADASLGGLVIGDKYLDDGKLYVAKFNADGSGAWIELNIANSAIAGYAAYAFADQADVLINSRLAADALGATRMDRPEWTGVHPGTGDVYVTLTNNSNRGKTGSSGRPLDAANPRYYADIKGASTAAGNNNGHIVRMREASANPAAVAFQWDVYLFGAQATADSGADNVYHQAHVNISGLTDDNDFSSPDGLWFSQKTHGLMWIQTDDGAYTDVTNCMMLAALPGSHGDGGAVAVTSKAVPSNGNADQTVTTYAGKDPGTANLRRFLVGPKGCEITGICETPDGKAIFVNIQHPGENTSAANIGNTAAYESHWPQGGGARPRSSTIVITKDDNGIVGL